MNRRENVFLNRLKISEETIVDKVESIGVDVKNVVNRLETIEQLLPKSDEFPKSSLLLTHIKPSMTANSNQSDKQMHLESIFRPIVDQMTQDLRSLIHQCFDDFKKTVIDCRIEEIIGENSMTESVRN